MKKKKSFLSLGLIALVLVLGVGYAVVTSTTLTINGTAKTTTTNSEINVSFEGTVDYEASKAYVDATGTTATEGSTTASIAVKDLSRIGDKAVVTYTIQNTETDLGATLTKPTITGGNEYFKITTKYVGGQDTQLLPKQSTTTLEVTVELIKTPTEAKTTDIKIELNATPVAQ